MSYAVPMSWTLRIRIRNPISCMSSLRRGVAQYFRLQVVGNVPARAPVSVAVTARIPSRESALIAVSRKAMGGPNGSMSM